MLVRNAAPTQQAAAPVDVLELLERGDRKAAIAALIDAHGDAVYGFCVRMLGDRVVAEDVAQQVFLEAHRDIDRFERRSSLATWLKGIANHRCRDAIKSRRRREQRLQQDDIAALHVVDPAATPTERVERAQLFAALEGCLQELSTDVRMAVVLRFQSGMTYDEMAEVLYAKPDALHARVSRALPVLRRCLESKGWTP
jgi:RNA polymerase sigma-70 factor (ECF subfamily)